MQAQKDLAKLEKLGMSTAPVCVAKTQMSLSHDPLLRNRPTGFIVPVRALLPSAGAGFVVALCGDMQRMPGLGKTPAFQNIDIDAQGRTIGAVLGCHDSAHDSRRSTQRPQRIAERSVTVCDSARLCESLRSTS